MARAVPEQGPSVAALPRDEVGRRSHEPRHPLRGYPDPRPSDPCPSVRRSRALQHAIDRIRTRYGSRALTAAQSSALRAPVHHLPGHPS
jgi:hypothetical protein